MGVLLSSALADVHLCCVDTAWLWVGGRQGAQILHPDGLYSRLILFLLLTSAQQYCFRTHHRPMDVPECPLLAVQDLPLRLVLLPVNPAINRKKPQREHVWQRSGMRHGHANTPDKEGRASTGPVCSPQQSRPGLTSTYITDIY